MAIDINSAIGAYNTASKIGGDIKGIADIPSTGTRSAGGSGFSDMVASSIDDAIDTAYKSESVSKLAIAGKAELHELVTAVTAAEITVQSVVAVRDKVINAYQDIMKMPI